MQINCLSNLKKTTVIAHSSMIPVSKNIFIHYNANKANNILTPDQKMYIGISLTKTVHYTDRQRTCNYTSFFASKNPRRCLICHKPTTTKRRV